MRVRISPRPPARGLRFGAALAVLLLAGPSCGGAGSTRVRGGGQEASTTTSEDTTTSEAPPTTTEPTTAEPTKISWPATTRPQPATTVPVVRTTVTVTTTPPPPVPPGSGVEGIVFVGPQCPVQRVDQPCPDRSGPSDVSLVRPDGTVVVTARATDDGHFQLPAPAGTYRLEAGPGNVGIGGCKTVPLTVEPDRYTHSDIYCDTGIR